MQPFSLVWSAFPSTTLLKFAQDRRSEVLVAEKLFCDRKILVQRKYLVYLHKRSNPYLCFILIHNAFYDAKALPFVAGFFFFFLLLAAARSRFNLVITRASTHLHDMLRDDTDNPNHCRPMPTSCPPILDFRLIVVVNSFHIVPTLVDESSFW